MRTQRYFVALLAAVAAGVFASAFATINPASEGLAAVKSSTLDEVYLRHTGRRFGSSHQREDGHELEVAA